MENSVDLSEGGYALYHSVGHRPNGTEEMSTALTDFSAMWTSPILDVWPNTLNVIEEFRETFSKLISPEGNADEIGLVDSVTSGFMRIIDGLGVEYLEGKSVLIADDAFPSLHFLLQGMEKLLKFKIKRVGMRQGQFNVEDSDFITELRSNQVALALVTWVSSTTSAMVDLEAISEAAPSDCVLVCDATQCLGIRDLNLPLRYDALISTSLKWLNGTAGAGVVWVRESSIDLFHPKFRGWFSQENPMNWDIENFNLSTNSKRFENGTPNPLPYVASLPGLKWVVEGGYALQKEKNMLMTKALLSSLTEANLDIVTPIEETKRGGSVMVNVQSQTIALKIISDLSNESVLIDNRGQILRFSQGILTEDFALKKFTDCLKKYRKTIRECTNL